MICSLLNCAIANDLDRPSRSFQLFLSDNKCSLLFRSLIESPGVCPTVERSTILIVFVDRSDRSTVRQHSASGAIHGSWIGF